MLALYLAAVLSLTTSPSRALPLPESEATWTQSGPPAHDAIHRMRQLELTPLVPPAPDLVSLRAEAQALRKKIDQAKSPPPGIGVFFGEGPQAAAVSQLLIGGPADKAGVRIGDVFIAVDGTPVGDYLQIGAAMAAGAGPFDVALAGRAEHVALVKRPPELLTREFLASLDARGAALFAELAAIESRASSPRADRVKLLERAHSLETSLKALGEELSQALIKASAARYRSS